MFVAAEAGAARLAVHARELRGERSLTEVAGLAGIRQDALGKIERGETTSIRFETILRLCGAVQVDVGELFTVEPSRPASPATLYEDILAGVRAGAIVTHSPVGRGVGAAAAPDAFQDLDEAADIMAHASEPAVPRGRRRAPLVAR